MNRNTLIAIIVVLVAALAVLGWMYYQDSQTSRLEIKLGGEGISVESK